MSSLFTRRQNRYHVTAVASQCAVAASLLMIVYLLTEGWLW
jgi:hypothetical protein